MVVDTSAMLAILLGEADALRMATAIQSAAVKAMAAATYVELAMVALSRRGTTVAEIDRQLATWGIEVVPTTPGQARLAAEAFARYGKGRHPAGLNFGDCFAYALARDSGRPLLFKGGDFALTDIAAA
jgi:ribonuclease VapC